MADPSDYFTDAHDGLAGIMGYLLNVNIPPNFKKGILRNAMKISKNLIDNEEKLRELQTVNNKLMATRRIKYGTWSLCPDTADALLGLNKRRECIKKDTKCQQTKYEMTDTRADLPELLKLNEDESNRGDQLQIFYSSTRRPSSDTRADTEELFMPNKDKSNRGHQLQKSCSRANRLSRDIGEPRTANGCIGLLQTVPWKINDAAIPQKSSNRY